MQENGFHHVPVMFEPVMEWMNPRPDGVPVFTPSMEIFTTRRRC